MNKQVTKSCPMCGTEKPLDEFYVCKSHKTGVGTYCKLCNHAITKVNKAKRRKKRAIERQTKDKELQELVSRIKRYLNNKPAGTGFMITVIWCEDVFRMKNINPASLQGRWGLGHRFSAALDSNPMLLGCAVKCRLEGKCRNVYITKEVQSNCKNEAY